MSIVKENTHDINATITTDSKPGQFTKFIVKVPSMDASKAKEMDLMTELQTTLANMVKKEPKVQEKRSILNFTAG